MAEIVLYLIFGILTVAINILSYFLLRSALSVTVSSVFAWIFAVIFAFFSNKIFVFRSKNRGIKKNAAEFARFLSARIFSEILELFLLNILLSENSEKTKEFFIKSAVNILVVLINYIASKIFVFKNKSA